MLKRRQTGVSLVEVIVGLAILALLLGLGVPQYGIFLANARLKATTDVLVSGLSLARAEAVKRNARVDMVLTNDEPVEAEVATAAAATNGTNWIVREWVPRTTSFNFIEGKLGAEGSGTEASRVQIASASVDATYNGVTSFTGFGALTIGSAITFDITNPSGGACDQAPPATRGPMRCLRVVVSPGGQIRTCDPAVPAAAVTDTRRC